MGGRCSNRKAAPGEPSSMPKIEFVKEKTTVEVQPGTNLREAARQAGISLYSGPDRYLNCRGFGLCGTCRVLVKKGMENLSPRSFMERANLSLHPLSIFAGLGHENEIRLGCQVQVNGDCSIETTPGLNLYGENFWQKPYPNK